MVSKRGFIRMALAAAAGLMGTKVADAQKKKEDEHLTFESSGSNALLTATANPTQYLSLVLGDKGEPGLGDIRVEYHGKTVEIKAVELWRAIDPTWKPANNECPVCGTVAETFHRQTYRGFMKNCRSANDPKDPYLVQCDPQEDIPNGPTEKIVRCARCNAAFWQDAVK